MKLTSGAFAEGGKIPSIHTCDGNHTSPALAWDGAPSETQSFVLIMTDTDIPEAVKKSMGIEVFDHWTVFNIPSSITSVPEGKEPAGIPGLNSRGKTGYVGPCPPDREHRYFFKIYALDVVLGLVAGASREEIEKAMESHILGEAALLGRYERAEKARSRQKGNPSA